MTSILGTKLWPTTVGPCNDLNNLTIEVNEHLVADLAQASRVNLQQCFTIHSHGNLSYNDLLELDKLLHSPYSPDLGPCDFALLQHLKQWLRRTHFENLSFFVMMFLLQYPKTGMPGIVFWKWVNHRCMELQGRYFDRGMTC